MKKLIFSLVLATSLLTACKQQQKQDSLSVEEGVTKSLNDSRKKSIGNILYTLILDIPQQKEKEIKGGLQIDFQLKRNEQPLVLDFDAPKKNLLRVLANGNEVDYRFEKGHIILPVSALKVGINQLKIDYIVNDRALNRQENYLVSHFFPDGASAAFPCFDQPNLKALMLLNLMVPPEWVAMANAPARQVDTGVSKVLYQFEKTKPISTYLFGFAAGDFKKVSKERKGRTVNLYFLPGDAEKISGNEDYLFDLQLNALEWMEAYTQIAFPFQKYDMLLLPSLPASRVAQPGLVYFKSDILLVDGSAGPEQDLLRARAVGFKTAQMWFGNLVTIDWFGSAWMVETLDDYLASKMVNPSFTTIYHKLEFLNNHYPKSYAADRTAGNHPLQQTCNNLKDAGLLYDDIYFHKGPIVFRQLEKILSEERLRSALSDFLRKYSFANASWDDLVAVLDEHTHDDMQAWCDVWVKEAGMPEYKAFQEVDLYVINQYDQNQKDVIWPQQLDLYKKWEAGWQHKEVWDDTKRFEFPIPDMVDIVMINWDSHAYGYFFQNLREKNFLLSKRMLEFDPLRRGISYITLWENLLRENMLPLDMREALELYLKRENRIENIRLLLSYYRKMFWRYSDSEKRSGWAKTMEPLLWEKIKSAETPEEKYAFYKAFTETAITRDGIEKMLGLWNGKTKIKGLKLSEGDRLELAFELEVRKGLQEAEAVPADILKQQKQQMVNEKLLKRLAFVSPALDKSEGVRSSFFEQLKSPENRKNEDFVIEAVRYLHHPLRVIHAETLVLPSLEMLDEIRQTGGLLFPDRWLQATFYGHRNSVAAETALNFLDAHPGLNPLLKQKVLQAIDPVQRAVKLEADLELEE